MTEFKHREYFKSYQISFWKDGRASERAEANGAEMHVGSWHMNFKYPEEENKMRTIGYMLEAAFAIGRIDKTNEIRKALDL
jgi:hypothetical protein